MSYSRGGRFFRRYNVRKHLASASTIVFDLAGTLTPSVPAFAKSTAWEAYASVVRPADVEASVLALEAAEDSARVACVERGSSWSFRRVLADSGMPYRLEAVEAFIDTWRPWLRVPADISSRLRIIHDAGYRVGLVSNTIWPADWHGRLLEADGARASFDSTVYSSSTPWAKPNPRIFAYALRELGCDRASDALFVGDRTFEDLDGAHLSGMKAVLVGNEPEGARSESEQRWDIRALLDGLITRSI
ncbi:HAD family hydrolase [Clavibacter michiganensis]|uniref:HAD family hydrolase n=1 Tax=Clavibacter michiganensis TaxID=28447 RepID=UPI003CC91990